MKTKPHKHHHHHNVCDLIRNTTTVNLLKWAAGQRISCPNCDEVLDWTETVIVGSTVCCDVCFFEAANKVVAAHARAFPCAESADTARRILEGSDITYCRNIHVADDGTIGKGARLLYD